MHEDTAKIPADRELPSVRRAAATLIENLAPVDDHRVTAGADR